MPNYECRLFWNHIHLHSLKVKWLLTNWALWIRFLYFDQNNFKLQNNNCQVFGTSCGVVFEAFFGGRISGRNGQKLKGRPLSRPCQSYWAPWRPFWNFERLIKQIIKSKNSFNKTWLDGPFTLGWTCSRPCQSFLNPMEAILYFWDSQ